MVLALLLPAGVAAGQGDAGTAPLQARWIAASADGAGTGPMPIFRRGFVLRGKPVRATLRISGLGQYEAHVNGRNVTDAVLTPGWTLYRKHVFYNCYDVTGLVRAGENAIGVMLGNGMYNVPADPGRYDKFTGTFGQPKLIAELTVRSADGTTQVVRSDESWRTTTGPIVFSQVYGGEDFDARLEPKGWDAPGFDDMGWAKAMPVDGPGGALVEETMPPVKAFETFEPVRVTHPKAGLTVYDLGQNFAGWPEIAVTGPRGASVRLIAGELLGKDGLVTQRSAAAGPDDPNAFTYTLGGGGTTARPEQWHPRFSYYGFRYVQVETASPGVRVEHLDGRFLHDDAAVVGTFSSSDELLNRIHGLIRRAMLSNLMSVLTDCPQREKLGWLEQTHLAGTALMMNWDLNGLYAALAMDRADSQVESGPEAGLVPSIAPEYAVFPGAFRDSPEWGSAVVLSPWIAYQFSGDAGPLRKYYSSMQRYVAFLGTRARGHLLAYGLGDWYDIGPGEPGESKLTSKGVTATAIYYQDLTTLARIAKLVGDENGAQADSREAEAVKAAFNARYFHAATKTYDTGSQTAQSMPLVAGLVPEGAEDGVLAALVADIRRHENHVTAGDIGFHYVVRALTDGGRSDVLFDMLERRDAPSYGDQLAKGATALTEAWDANPSSSQNHFMLGHAEEWFYRGLAGIQFDMSREPGEQIWIQPAVVGTLTSAGASFQSKLGLIASRWERASAEADAVTLEVTIPEGATAKILFPAEFRGAILLDGHGLDGDQRVIHANLKNATPHASVRAGTFRFTLRRGTE
jgi:hypothetical protein